MTPQIGDRVTVRYETRPDRKDGFVIQGARPVIETVAGTLGVEAGEDGHVFGIVIETDGGATFVPRSAIVSVEVLQ